MAMACGRERPDMTSSSRALSKAAESLPPGSMMGKSFLISSPNSGEARTDWRACIQIDVAAQGVDFAVVGDVAVGVRELPGGEGVGGEALVHEAERADDFGIAQFRIEIGDLGGEQQSFIDDGAGGEARDVDRPWAPASVSMRLRTM